MPSIGIAQPQVESSFIVYAEGDHVIHDSLYRG